MTVDELIKKLTKLRNQYGDVLVKVVEWETGGVGDIREEDVYAQWYSGVVEVHIGDVL